MIAVTRVPIKTSEKLSKKRLKADWSVVVLISILFKILDGVPEYFEAFALFWQRFSFTEEFFLN